MPDFIFRLQSDDPVYLILETKGYDPLEEVKRHAAERWVPLFLYARVSSREQEREGYSIPAQRKLLAEYARSRGFSIEREFIDIAGKNSATCWLC